MKLFRNFILTAAAFIFGCVPFGDTVQKGNILPWVDGAGSAGTSSCVGSCDCVFARAATLGASPSSLSGLAIWLASDVFTADADATAVSSWTDCSGSDHPATQSTPANMPAYYGTAGGNGRPVVRFDGLASRMATATFTLDQPETVFVVAKFVTAPIGDDATLIDGFDRDHMLIHKPSGSTDSIFIYAGGNDSGLSSITVTDSHIYTVIYNGASTSLSVDAGTPDIADHSSFSGSGLTLGEKGGAQGGFGNVDISEVIVYSGALSGGNISSIECYLSNKYGISVGHGC